MAAFLLVLSAVGEAVTPTNTMEGIGIAGVAIFALSTIYSMVRKVPTQQQVVVSFKDLPCVEHTKSIATIEATLNVTLANLQQEMQRLSAALEKETDARISKRERGG